MMQKHSSYVVTDPKGTVLVECGEMLKQGKPKKDSKGRTKYKKDHDVKVLTDKNGTP